MHLQVDDKSVFVQGVLLVSIVSTFESNYITTIRSQSLIARKRPAEYMRYPGHGLIPSCEHNLPLLGAFSTAHYFNMAVSQRIENEDAARSIDVLGKMIAI